MTKELRSFEPRSSLVRSVAGATRRLPEGPLVPRCSLVAVLTSPPAPSRLPLRVPPPHRDLTPPQPRRRRLPRRLPIARRATLSPDDVRLLARAELSPCREPRVTPDRVATTRLIAERNRISDSRVCRGSDAVRLLPLPVVAGDARSRLLRPFAAFALAAALGAGGGEPAERAPLVVVGGDPAEIGVVLDRGVVRVH